MGQLCAATTHWEPSQYRPARSASSGPVVARSTGAWPTVGEGLSFTILSTVWSTTTKGATNNKGSPSAAPKPQHLLNKVGPKASHVGSTLPWCWLDIAGWEDLPVVEVTNEACQIRGNSFWFYCLGSLWSDRSVVSLSWLLVVHWRFSWFSFHRLAMAHRHTLHLYLC